MRLSYQHQKLRVIREVLDEWFAGWSAVFCIVTEDLLCIATGNVEEAVVAQCHSSGTIKTTRFWRDKDAGGVPAKIMPQN